MPQSKNTRFSFASLNPAQQPDRDDQANAQQESAAALVAALRDMRHHLMVAFPQHVYSDPIVFGGPTTKQGSAYALANEFGTPSQYRVLQVAFGGVGQVIVGQSQGLTAPAVTDTIDPTSRTHGQVFASAGAGTISGADDAWTDLPAGGVIYAAVSVTTDSAWVTVQFRRRVSPGGVFAEGHS